MYARVNPGKLCELVLRRVSGQVAGILTKPECSKLIAAAEAHGFARQQSRGPKFGEVSI